MLNSKEAIDLSGSQFVFRRAPISLSYLFGSMSVSLSLFVFARILYFFLSWIDLKTLGDVARG